MLLSTLFFREATTENRKPNLKKYSKPKQTVAYFELLRITKHFQVPHWKLFARFP